VISIPRPNIIESGETRCHKGFTHYGPSAGLPVMRATIAGYVSETRGRKRIAKKSL